MFFGSFTIRGLMVDCLHLQIPGVTKHRKSRGCKTRKEAVEDRDHRPVCDGEVIDP